LGYPIGKPGPLQSKVGMWKSVCLTEYDY